jgi:hypothetical protein
MRRWQLCPLLALLLMAGPIRAATLNLSWNPSALAESYQLYYGIASGIYDTVLDTGPSTMASVGGLTEGTAYFFAATARNQAGESGYSNEVRAVPMALPPVDTTPPATHIVSPLPGATVPRNAVTVVAIEASDASGIRLVQVFVNNTLAQRLTNAPFTYAWDVPAPPLRDYVLSCTAEDQAGNVGTCAPVAVQSSCPNCR